MKTIKVSEATGIQLDWLVARALDLYVYISEYAESPWLMVRSGTFDYRCPEFSTDWSDGGPIIEQEGITVVTHYGTTPLIATMRC